MNCLLRRAATLPLVLAAASAGASEAADNADILRRLDALEKAQAEARTALQERDARIRELEAATATPASAPPSSAEYYGNFVPGRGFNLANTTNGTVDFSLYTYLRYLNQGDLEETYTDSFGNTRTIDQRNDMQIQKVILYFKGWVYDPDFSYVTYAWTSNTSQGDPAQVVLAGFLNYHVSDAVNIGGGISGLPSTRSMEGTAWPAFLHVDYRTIADEYFRGSYTTGVFATGKLGGAAQYRVMLGNNLSQLGVNGPQMDDTFDTLAAAVWWMPTTGEFGPGGGFGDYEFHERLATRIGLHATHSTEDKQSQPGTEDPENTQIRLSDGTSLFQQDAFGAGIAVQQARYHMATVDAGLKYRGYALEGELFWRQVDRIEANGPLPFREVVDHGYQLQASAMLVPKTLQAYVSGSQIDGDYGKPSDVAVGLNWFPKKDTKKLRVNAELLHLDDSPVGYSSVPFTVGGNGTVFVTHLELAL